MRHGLQSGLEPILIIEIEDLSALAYHFNEAGDRNRI
jgi:hypothetical protein